VNFLASSTTRRGAGAGAGGHRAFPVRRPRRRLSAAWATVRTGRIGGPALAATTPVTRVVAIWTVLGMPVVAVNLAYRAIYDRASSPWSSA
jgi:hypothetical protein